MKWHTRLEKQRTRLGWSKAELSRRSGISYDRINKYVRGEVDNPRGEALEQISKAIGIPVKLLLFGPDSDSSGSLGGYDRIDIKKIPLITMKDLEKQILALNLIKFLQSVEAAVAVNARVGSDAFGVVIEDDSMSPNVNSGDVVICDPHADILPGNLIFAKIGGADRVVFRKLRPQTSNPSKGPAELIALNEDYPNLSIGARQVRFIIGRGVRHIREI